MVAVKNVTSNERYFIAGPGGVPTMPASILTEAMAQAGAILILAEAREPLAPRLLHGHRPRALPPPRRGRATR